MKKIFLIVFPMFLICSCLEPETDIVQNIEVEGLAPVYVSEGEWDDIRTIGLQPIGTLGKIYYKDPYIFINESNRGVHVFDNSNPANPQKISFLQIPGCNDIAVKGNIMYADNVKDLVAIDITDLNNIQVVKRVENVYPEGEQLFPESYTGYFECVDTKNGFVVGWETVVLHSPECWR